ncbi:MAG TPA: NAD(P)/FAD-dependent oxidoreductase, partial [Micromonospora sp.]
SWRARYDDLRLNTAGWMSGLPGCRATIRRYGEFPSRDAWVRYLEDYTAAMRLRVEYGAAVSRVDRDGAEWVVTGEDGDRRADVVVVATGPDREPWLPEWPGSAGFTGELAHAATYRNSGPYRGRDVLVVGANVSGSEIAHLLVLGGAARVRVAVRTPPNIITRKAFGLSVNVTGIALEPLPAVVGDLTCRVVWGVRFGRLDRFGLPRSPEGVATTIRRRDQAPAYDDGFVANLKAGRVTVVPAVTGFDRDDVLLADGSRIRPEAVLAATGYRSGLEPLVGHLGVLDDRGNPLIVGRRQHPNAPGLYFSGYRQDLTGQLRLMRLDARAIARAVAMP